MLIIRYKFWFALQIFLVNYAVYSLDSSIKINTDLMARAVNDHKLNMANKNVNNNDDNNNDKINNNNKENLLNHKNVNLLNVNNSNVVASPANVTATSNMTSTSISNITSTSNMTTTEGDNHICLREEQYIEEMRIPSMEPVRIRTSSWCMEFPPRCSNYKTEMREVIKVQNLTKTRTIRFCCAGYEGNISINDTICKPVCRGGCGRGYCTKPDVCNCEPGYMGKHCTQRCDHDHWGLNCANNCQCLNGAVCDNKSGLCHCISGWTGDFCEKLCPSGTHGVMCRKVCQCENNQCHPQTGTCVTSEGNSNVIIANLNSTIANITNNLDRLAKNIDSIATSTVMSPQQIAVTMAPAITEMHSPKPLNEVYVIKQDDILHGQTPKIILHQGGNSGLFDNFHDVVRVIANDLGNHNMNNKSYEDTMEYSFGTMPTQKDDRLKVIVPASSDHETNLLSMILIILLVVLVAIALGFLYVYRRYHIHKAQVETALAARSMSLVPGVNTPVIITQSTPSPTSTVSNDIFSIFPNSTGSLSKSFSKPLPDLPAFTQMPRNKTDGPDLYDIPDRNGAMNAALPPRKYVRKESLYSVVMPKSRKPSMDSHLYDEIPYTTTDPVMSTTTHNHSLMPSNHHPHTMNHYTRTHSQFQHHQQHQLSDQVNDIFLQVPTTASPTHNLTNIAHI